MERFDESSDEGKDIHGKTWLTRASTAELQALCRRNDPGGTPKKIEVPHQSLMTIVSSVRAPWYQTSSGHGNGFSEKPLVLLASAAISRGRLTDVLELQVFLNPDAVAPPPRTRIWHGACDLLVR
ncbi:hypothetical protein FYK55_11195 [Roseiconus nitratireducens]|uniref:Uncharacterized protein n=1 Tax=Roseiconus nitratireducens TaxID=2605748 RepID=A0A5M6D871_9BACT|nr:hypothetical protein [Roseiconus nitratireducens]KAA5543744.1 hypothetical protein FYK55_11195 [Roseiconus nitratireducens]